MCTSKESQKGYRIPRFGESWLQPRQGMPPPSPSTTIKTYVDVYYIISLLFIETRARLMKHDPPRIDKERRNKTHESPNAHKILGDSASPTLEISKSRGSTFSAHAQQNKTSYAHAARVDDGGSATCKLASNPSPTKPPNNTSFSPHQVSVCPFLPSTIDSPAKPMPPSSTH